MVKLGYLLITAGFLAGAYFAVLQVEGVPWGAWALAIAFGVVGVALARLGKRQSATSEGRLEGNISTLRKSLSSIVEKIGGLQAELPSLNVYDVRHRIDERFMGDLNAFVEARESIMHRYGVQAYANVMTDFATGERTLNRAWSASTDGYVDEVARSVAKAEIHFRDAQEKFQALG
ncbi:MAG: hypothetical protein KDD47_24665 [Acidobacteria bacterium]|nr:hypothetical protein [Acidobacteriota bacterium]